MDIEDSKTNGIDSNDRTIITINNTGKEGIGLSAGAATAERTEVLYGEDNTVDRLL